MDNDILTRLEKQMEGNGLALAAVAEVLQKMDARLTKAEDEEEEDEKDMEEKAMLEAAEMEKSMLVKAIAEEVRTELLKESAGQSDNGMDVDGENTRTATKAGNSTDADDSEEAVTIDTKTENVQGIIQAMQKQLGQLTKEYGMDETEDEDEPVVTDDEDDEDDVEGIFNMKKAMETMVKAETEKRLEKMGFKEETSLQKPVIKNYDQIGIDGTTPIKKSEPAGDPVDQLADLSYKQLREMQFAIEGGQTDGVPQELL